MSDCILQRLVWFLHFLHASISAICDITRWTNQTNIYIYKSIIFQLRCLSCVISYFITTSVRKNKVVKYLCHWSQTLWWHLVLGWFSPCRCLCLLLSSTDSSRGLDSVFNKCCSWLYLVTIFLAYATNKQEKNASIANPLPPYGSLHSHQDTLFFKANTFPFSCFSSHIPDVYKMKRYLFLPSWSITQTQIWCNSVPLVAETDTLKKCCACELHADCGYWHAFLRCYTQIWKARKSLLSSAHRVPF